MPTIDLILDQRERERQEEEKRREARQGFWETLTTVKQEEQQGAYGFLLNSYAGPTERRQAMVDYLRRLPLVEGTNQRYFPIEPAQVERASRDPGKLLKFTGLKEPAMVPSNPALAILAREAGLSDDEIATAFLAYGPDMGIDFKTLRPEALHDAIRMQAETIRSGGLELSQHYEQVSPLELGKRTLASIPQLATLGRVKLEEPVPAEQPLPGTEKALSGGMGLADVSALLAGGVPIAGVRGSVALGAKMIAGEVAGGIAGRELAGEKGEEYGRLVGMLAGPAVIGGARRLAALPTLKLPEVTRVPSPFGGTVVEIPTRYPVMRLVSPDLAQAYRSGQILARRAALPTMTVEELTAAPIRTLTAEERALMTMPGAIDPRYSVEAARVETVAEAGQASSKYGGMIREALSKVPIPKPVTTAAQAAARAVSKPIIAAVNPSAMRLRMFPEIGGLIERQHELMAREGMRTHVVQQLARAEERGTFRIDPDTGELLNPAKPIPEGMSKHFNDVLSNTKYIPYLSEDQLRIVNYAQSHREELLRIMQAKGIAPQTLFEGAEGHSYLPRVIATRDGMNQLRRLYADNMLGRSPLFKNQRWFEYAEDALANATKEIKTLNSLSGSFNAWYEAANYTLFWDDFTKWLRVYGETPAERAMAAQPGVSQAYLAATRRYGNARRALWNIEHTNSRAWTKVTEEGIVTPKLGKVSTKFLRESGKRGAKWTQAKQNLEVTRREMVDARFRYKGVLEQVRRPKPEGEMMLVDLKMGPRVFKEDFAREVRVMMGRQRGIVANGARMVNSFNNLFRPLMAVGDLSWWMIQGYMGVGGAEPAFIRGLAQGYASAFFAPDIYFSRMLRYEQTGLLKRFFDGGGVWFGTDLPAEWDLPLNVGRTFERKYPKAAGAIKGWAKEHRIAGAVPRFAGTALSKGYPLKPFIDSFNRASNIAAIELFDSWSRLADDLIALDTANVGRAAPQLAPKMRGVLADLAAGRDPRFKPVNMTEFSGARRGMKETEQAPTESTQWKGVSVSSAEGQAGMQELERLGLEVEAGKAPHPQPKAAAKPALPTAEEQLEQGFPLTGARSTKLARGTARTFGPVGGELRTVSRAQLDREIAAVVNKARGTINTTLLGMSPTQKAIEGGLFFAPRYMRAYMGLVSDAMQAGMRGNRARYFLARGMTGLVMDYVAITQFANFFGADWQPDFDPRSPRFFTVPIGGAHIGVGGGMYGLLRLGANVYTSRSLDDWMSVDKNPAMKRLRAMASPALNLLWDSASRRTYVGEPMNSPGEVAKHALISGLPFAIQSAIEEGGAAAAGTFAGARAFPVLAWEWRDYYRDQGAQEGFEKFGWRDPSTGKPLNKWDQLNRAQQKQVYTETESGKKAKRWADKWMGVAANQGRDWAQKEQSYEQFKGDVKLQLAQAVVNMKKGEITPNQLIQTRKDIGAQLQQERDRLDTQYPDTGDEPKEWLEDVYTDLYLFLDADKDGDGVVSDREWRQNDTEREMILAAAAKDGIDLEEYSLERAGITWGHPVLDTFEREYQTMKRKRDEYYSIPRWQGFSRQESEKIDTYLRFIPAYQEQLQRAATKQGYPLESVQDLTRSTAREILRNTPPKDVKSERDRQLFSLALQLDADPDLQEQLDGGVDSPRYHYLLDNPNLLRWFPKVGVTLSVAERLGMPQYNQTAEEIMAETRVATDTQTVETMQRLIEEARAKARKR